MECRDVRGLNTDSVGPGPSAGFYLGMFMAFGDQARVPIEITSNLGGTDFS